MRYFERCLLGLVAVLLLMPVNALPADEYEGTVRVGYLFLDRDGNHSVNQSTFNLYQGLEASLERFSYRFDNGLNFSANIQNVTLGNRSLSVGATKTGIWGTEFHHNAYRRQYDFNGDVETKRYRSGGTIWWRARPWLKAYGGAGVTKKNGDMLALFEGDETGAANAVDFAYWNYHAGVTLQHSRKSAQVEYRGSTFTDDRDFTNDRRTRRIRASASAPVPNFEDLMLNAGYQHFRLALEERIDTLSAHTVWGGARFNYRGGYTLRYSFIFDRARRTGDLTDSDNITHAIYAGKAWLRQGGFTLGYRYRIKDDALDELTGNGYFVSAWWRPVGALNLRAGYGSEDLTVDEGRTLTGKTERSRGWFTARYRKNNNWIRLSLRNLMMDYDEIGSSTDYLRLATDLSVEILEYGTVTGSYSYATGEYENSAGEFEYNEHIIKGDVTAKEYRNLTLGFGGTYLRNLRDLDVEGFSVRLSALYRFKKDWAIQGSYSSHNFDNLDDPSPVYTEYYTDNVVQISLSYDL